MLDKCKKETNASENPKGASAFSFLNLRVSEDQWAKKAKLTKKTKCLFDILSTELCLLTLNYCYQ